MKYPFNTKQEYLSDVQKQHFDRFLEVEPKVGYIYSNSNGESRCVIGVAYPSGVIMKETIYSEILRNGSKNYHTPLAKARGGLSEVKWLDNEDGTHSSTSQVWMIWIDSGTKAKQRKTGQILDMKEIVRAMTKSKKAELTNPDEKEAMIKAETKVRKPKAKKRGRPKTRPD